MVAHRLRSAAAIYRGGVSVKGVVLHEGGVVLLRNEREQWELPGGRLELGQTPERCVAREIAEELGLTVRVGPLLDVWLYEHIVPGAHVFIVTYGCHAAPFDAAVLAPSSEHTAVGCFSLAEIGSLAMPDGYRRSISRWAGDPDRASALRESTLNVEPRDWCSAPDVPTLVASHHSSACSLSVCWS
jgi:8-oxo-dGTP pyrophosphatase MutT (NUDIX family)